MSYTKTDANMDAKLNDNLDDNLDNKIDDLTLEQYILDELPPARVKQVELLLDTQPALRTRLEELEQSNNNILEKYTPARMATAINDRVRVEKAKQEARQPQRSPLLKRLFYAVPTLTAAVIAFFVILPIFKGGPANPVYIDPQTGLEITRLKGEEKGPLMIYRQIENSGKELLKANDTAREGDLLQLAYNSGGRQYGVILSIDGRGVVTLHFPESESGSTKLEPRQKVLLKTAYELDDAPDFERFFFITSFKPIDVANIKTRAQQLAGNEEKRKVSPINLDKNLEQNSILIRKGERK